MNDGYESARAFWRETSQSQKAERTVRQSGFCRVLLVWAALAPRAKTHARRKHKFRREQQAHHNIKEQKQLFVGSCHAGFRSQSVDLDQLDRQLHLALRSALPYFAR
jgi:hypothetical protein